MSRVIDSCRLPVAGSMLEDVVKELMMVNRPEMQPLTATAMNTLAIPTHEGMYVHACTCTQIIASYVAIAM